MKKKEFEILANNLALRLKAIGESDAARIEKRGILLSIADDIWYDLICFHEQARRWYPDRDAWIVACGFRFVESKEAA